MYNCNPPTGYWNFKAPGATKGGIVICPDTSPNSGMHGVLYAITPEFGRMDCVELMGLGTHLYSGVSPPVWAYS